MIKCQIGKAQGRISGIKITLNKIENKLALLFSEMFLKEITRRNKPKTIF